MNEHACLPVYPSSLTLSCGQIAVLNDSDPAGIPAAKDTCLTCRGQCFLEIWHWRILLQFPAKLLASDENQSTTGIVQENLETKASFRGEVWPNFLCGLNWIDPTWCSMPSTIAEDEPRIKRLVMVKSRVAKMEHDGFWFSMCWLFCWD